MAEKIRCTCCGKEKSVTQFYKSKSCLYKSIERLPICKECIGDIYNNYFAKFNDERLAIYYLCRKLDISFSQSCFNAVMSNKGSQKDSLSWKIYMQKFNSLGGQNGYGNTFDDSDEIDIKKDIEIENDISKHLIRKWGRGYTKEQYEILEDIYSEWCGGEDENNLSLSERKTYKMLTQKEMDIKIARESGSPTDKMEETYRKFMSDADVTLKDLKNKKDESDRSKLWGIRTMDIEKSSPAEYFKQKHLYRDADGFIDYLNRFVFRPIKNLLTGSKEYDKEFTIEEDNDLFVDGDAND